MDKDHIPTSFSFLFGVASRMVLGLFVCLVLIALFSRRMRWHRDALLTYLAGGLGIWGAMTSVYWGAQYIPSGLVSVMFGLTPIVTALLAAMLLGERALTPFRIIGMGLGVVGLGIIFGQSAELGVYAGWGMLAIILLGLAIFEWGEGWLRSCYARAKGSRI